MTELVKVQADECSVLDVVFVHGLDGDARKSWSKSRRSFWPEWLSRDVTGVAVWSLGYDAASSRWLGHAMPIQDRAINLLARLENQGIGQRPLCFVTHSMGGLVVKEMLLHAAEGRAGYAEFAAATRGVVFLATPHTGSDVVTKSIVKALSTVYRTTPGFDALDRNSAYLRQLNTRYRNWVTDPAVDIGHKTFYETRATRGVHVVDAGSADPAISGQTPIPVDANHIDICKPTGRSDLVYGQIAGFVADIVNAQQGRLADTSDRHTNGTRSSGTPDLVIPSSYVPSGPGAAATSDESPRSEKIAQTRGSSVTNSVDGTPENVIQAGSTGSVYVRGRTEVHHHDRRGLFVLGAVLLVAVVVIAVLSVWSKDHSAADSRDAVEKPPLSTNVPIAASLDIYPKNDCKSGWVVPTVHDAPIAHTDKPVDAVLGSGGSVVLTLQGLTADSVVLHSINVEIVSRKTAMSGTFLPSSCGSDVKPRFFHVDLDQFIVSAVTENGTSSLPYKVSGTDPEQIIITPTSASGDIQWRLRIPWSSGDRRGELLIDDGGKPIRTTATTSARQFCVEQPDGQRWVPRTSGASC